MSILKECLSIISSGAHKDPFNSRVMNLYLEEMYYGSESHDAKCLGYNVEAVIKQLRLWTADEVTRCLCFDDHHAHPCELYVKLVSSGTGTTHWWDMLDNNDKEAIIKAYMNRDIEPIRLW